MCLKISPSDVSRPKNRRLKSQGGWQKAWTELTELHTWELLRLAVQSFNLWAVADALIKVQLCEQILFMHEYKCVSAVRSAI